MAADTRVRSNGPARRLIFFFVLTVVLPGAVLTLFGLRVLRQERATANRQIAETLATSTERIGRAIELELKEWQRAADDLARGNPVDSSRWSDRLRLAASRPGGAAVLTGARERPRVLPAGQLLYELSAVDAIPPELLAAFERTSAASTERRGPDALKLYRDLMDGRWPLEKPTYAFYAQRLRDWMPAGEEARELLAEEDAKLALSLAVERFAREPRRLALDDDASPYIAFWHSEPFTAIVLGRSYLQSALLPERETRDLRCALVGADGRVLAGDSSGDTPTTYTLQAFADLPLQLRAWPRDPAALTGTVDRQQRLYLGTLAAIVALLIFGAFFTIHTLRTQIAIAQMKSDFVSTVSHEFRSPLAGITQLSEMLRDGRVAGDRQRQDYYELIAAEAQRLRRLVENILDFSRMEEGRKPYRFEPLEPAAWLREVAGDFQSALSGSGFALEADIPQALPTIVGDRQALTTAVHNLLDNAVKYSPTPGTARLAAVARERTLAISVRDRGIGIRDEDRARIFERFYRGTGDTSRQVKGVGLGLSLVRHIVDAHGGTIDVDSAAGEGSTFTIHLKALPP